jgi:hypothetical protein
MNEKEAQYQWELLRHTVRSLGYVPTTLSFSLEDVICPTKERIRFLNWLIQIAFPFLPQNDSESSPSSLIDLGNSLHSMGVLPANDLLTIQGCPRYEIVNVFKI